MFVLWEQRSSVEFSLVELIGKKKQLQMELLFHVEVALQERATSHHSATRL